MIKHENFTAINQTLFPVNKGFITVHDEFIKNGWNLVNNEIGFIVYNNHSQPFDDFIAVIENNKITVSVPIATTNYLYTTSFNNYFSACEYMLSHLQNIIKYATEKVYLTNIRKVENQNLKKNIEN